MATGDKRPVVMGAEKAVPNGVATLGEDGKLLEAQRPHDIPTGGLAGQMLVKDGTANYAAAWGGYHSNPNLLDNWCFADPINQRGQTTYTEAGYTIDRWYTVSTRKTIVNVTNGAVSLAPANLAESEVVGFYSRLDHQTSEFAGREMTVSALDADGHLFYGSGIIPDTPPATTVAIFYAVAGDMGKINVSHNKDTGLLYVVFSTGRNQSWKAVKLEYGTTQTLAHQDAEGNWVLNDPPPNKALELAKCQRYYSRITTDAANYIPISGFVPRYTASSFYPVITLPGAVMRYAAATITYNSLDDFIACGPDGNVSSAITGISAYRSMATNGDISGIQVKITTSGLESGKLYMLMMKSTGYLGISVDI